LAFDIWGHRDVIDSADNARLILGVTGHNNHKFAALSQITHIIIIIELCSTERRGGTSMRDNID